MSLSARPAESAGEEISPARDVCPAPGARLSARGLTRRFGLLVAVEDLDISLPAGRLLIKQIVEIQIQELYQRLSERKIEIHLSDEGRALLASDGFDPDYGARPVKRTIQQAVMEPLATKLLAGEFQEGDLIIVDVVNDELCFRKGASEAPAKRQAVAAGS